MKYNLDAICKKGSYNRKVITWTNTWVKTMNIEFCQKIVKLIFF